MDWEEEKDPKKKESCLSRFSYCFFLLTLIIPVPPVYYGLQGLQGGCPIEPLLGVFLCTWGVSLIFVGILGAIFGTMWSNYGLHGAKFGCGIVLGAYAMLIIAGFTLSIHVSETDYILEHHYFCKGERHSRSVCPPENATIEDFYNMIRFKFSGNYSFLLAAVTHCEEETEDKAESDSEQQQQAEKENDDAENGEEEGDEKPSTNRTLQVFVCDSYSVNRSRPDEPGKTVELEAKYLLPNVSVSQKSEICNKTVDYVIPDLEVPTNTSKDNDTLHLVQCEIKTVAASELHLPNLTALERADIVTFSPLLTRDVNPFYCSEEVHLMSLITSSIHFAILGLILLIWFYYVCCTLRKEREAEEEELKKYPRKQSPLEQCTDINDSLGGGTPVFQVPPFHNGDRLRVEELEL